MMSYALYSNPLKVLVHYIIAGHYDNFTKYDYQSTPDDYNIYDLKRIKLPVALFYGVNDKFADEKVRYNTICVKVLKRNPWGFCCELYAWGHLKLSFTLQRLSNIRGCSH